MSFLAATLIFSFNYKPFMVVAEKLFYSVNLCAPLWVFFVVILMCVSLKFKYFFLNT